MNAIAEISTDSLPRVAVRADFPGLLNLLIRMHGEQAVHPLCVEKMARTIASAIDGGRALVVEVDGCIIASMAYDESEAWYSDERAYGDLWLYVAPEHRHSRHAIRLLRGIERMTADKKFFVGAVGKSTEGARLYGKGYVEYGRLFMKAGR